MTPSPNHHEKLEQLITRTLRELPVRQAPPSLESRVLAELARRAALPWWRRSFGHWPAPARATFIGGCAGLAKLALMATVWVMAGFDAELFQTAFAAPYAWLHRISSVATGVVEFFDIVLRNLPPLWLYGGLAFVALMYVALFGLGAAAYRTLYASR